MSSFSTFSPSFEQTYCCFRRAPSFLCSQLNEIAADDSPAENILIGTETSPKEIVAEPIECAGIGPAGDRVSVRPTASGYYHWREGGSILRPPRRADCHAVHFRSTMDHDRDTDPPAAPDPPPARRRAQAIPGQALRRPHARAIRLGRRRTGAAVHRPPACRHAPAFRPAARAGRCVEIVGCP